MTLPVVGETKRLKYPPPPMPRRSWLQPYVPQCTKRINKYTSIKSVLYFSSPQNYFHGNIIFYILGPQDPLLILQGN